MTSDSNMTPDAGGADWKRFNDEFFSVHASLNASPDALVSGLADEGIELIVDARPGVDREAPTMQAGCDQAGLYYVPAYTARELSDETISRYANLALRHKTCVVVEGDAEDLLSAIAAKRSIRRRRSTLGPAQAPKYRLAEGRHVFALDRQDRRLLRGHTGRR